jgi:hypothetical protein
MTYTKIRPEWPEPPDWTSAPCAQTDPDAWFPDDGHPNRTAKRICTQVCPYTAQCLEYALATDNNFGVWGGTSPLERKTIKAQRKREAKERAERPEVDADLIELARVLTPEIAQTHAA